MGQRNKLLDWLTRFIKGILIGAGTILPGVSGGALSAVFGLYEPIVNFLSDITNNFWHNVLFFLPFGLGGLFGVFALATPIDYGLKFYPVYVLWSFIGLIIGTIPSLYKQAGKKGREKRHIYITIATAFFSFVLLMYINHQLDINFPQNILSWLFAGSIFGSGLIIPGLSTSNFLIYFNLYHPLIESIRVLNWNVIIPLAISALLTVFLFAKLMKNIIHKAYPTVFHLILGVVIASTTIIIPKKELYTHFVVKDYILIIIVFLLGVAVAHLIGKLEESLD